MSNKGISFVTHEDLRTISPQCKGLGEARIEYKTPYFVIKKRGTYYSYETRQRQLAVLPIVNNRGIAMVRVYRPLIDDIPLELPAGGLNDEELLEEAAQRELLEETGINIKDVERFKKCIPLSAMGNRNPIVDNVIMVDVTQKEFDDRDEHDNEVESVELVDFDEVKKRIVGGQIYAAFTIAVVSRFLMTIEGEYGN